jgi:restriction system protein
MNHTWWSSVSTTSDAYGDKFSIISNLQFEKLFKEHLIINYSEEVYGVRVYKSKYIAEIIHKDLHEHKILSSYDENILENKVNEYIQKLKNRYKLLLEKKNNAERQKSVEEETNDAKKEIEDVENILNHTLNINDVVDWNKLKDRNNFNEPNPINQLKQKIKLIPLPYKGVISNVPAKPNEDDFIPKLSFFDNLFKSLKAKKVEAAKDDFNEAIALWEVEKRKIEAENAKEIDKEKEGERFYNLKCEEIKQNLQKDEIEWNLRKDEYYKRQNESNEIVDSLKEKYEKGDEDAVEEYCEIVLNNSEYPESFPKEFDIIYSSENKQIVIDYELPPIDKLPTLKEVKFVSKQRKEYHITDNHLNTLFDLTVLRICLRTVHEIFEADTANNINSVCFNGIVDGLDKSKGHRVRSCIISLQTTKEEFQKINLGEVDVKSCFKSLKGVGSSKLSGIIPIQPIIQIDKKDKRIVEHYDVADSIDESTNLAAMDWEDFENLIREIFEKEFQQNGGEVRVTQASRDGGVDAIAFDPDPIRGGKIIIQAKRYTNVVGVSAVRDLYGTVSHEGATKGILVTTSDFGSESYQFALGKPITLINGGRLLGLLEKYGYKAKIDILEAKKQNKE